MKTLLAVLPLSALFLITCSKQVSQPAVPQEPKHGYELAKTWDFETGKAKLTEATDYYTGGLARFGKTEEQQLQLNLDLAKYGLCVEEAYLNAVCNRPATNQTAAKACATAAELGPQHIAECNRLIDDLPKLIEKQNAALKEELKR
jgi:hypothetical protein